MLKCFWVTVITLLVIVTIANVGYMRLFIC